VGPRAALADHDIVADPRLTVDCVVVAAAELSVLRARGALVLEGGWPSSAIGGSPRPERRLSRTFGAASRAGLAPGDPFSAALLTRPPPETPFFHVRARAAGKDLSALD